VEFDYQIPTKLSEQIKASALTGAPIQFDQLIFNGLDLSMNTEIGQMIFKHANGVKEYYNANRIVFHYPSEHYLTVDGQTPRYGLEM